MRYDSKLLKTQEFQNVLRDAVHTVLLTRNIGFALASREMGLNRITLWGWFNSDRRGLYMTMCKVIDWLKKEWPISNPWPLKEIER